MEPTTLKRYLMAALALSMPLVLALAGLASGYGLLPSMSAYAHAGWVSWVFNGYLGGIGWLLVSYRDGSAEENHLLTAAGVFAYLVALIPVDPSCGRFCPPPTWHGTFSLLLFACLARVCLKHSKQTLALIADERVRARYRHQYNVLGSLMLLGPFLAIFLNAFAQDTGYLFWAETTGVVSFGLYWWLKSVELAHTAKALA